MCNLYSTTSNQRAILELTRSLHDRTGNLPPLPAIYPDSMAPIVREAEDGGRELTMMRWGMPDPSSTAATPSRTSGTPAALTGAGGWARRTAAWCL